MFIWLQLPRRLSGTPNRQITGGGAEQQLLFLKHLVYKDDFPPPAKVESKKVWPVPALKNLKLKVKNN